MKKIFNRTLILALAMPFMAHAQTATDDIKVGTNLTSAGIQMRGYFPKSFPLPPGDWEVLARFDEQYQLSNREGAVPPAPKVVLTLLNKDITSGIAAAVVTYSPEVTRIRWSNPTCEARPGGFADTVGTSTGSVDYVCADVTYNQAGLRRFISNAAQNSNTWAHTYLPPLIPHVANMPDANVWINLSSNQDRGRTYSMTLMGRNSPNVQLGNKVGDKVTDNAGEKGGVKADAIAGAKLGGQAGEGFDLAVRHWVNAVGKALIAAHNGDRSAIGEFPAVPK